MTTRSRSRNVWLFSLGTIGRDMAYGFFAGWLMSYIMYTKRLTDAQFVAVGVFFVVCRVYDAVIDPFLGGLIDNTRSRFGKFKPWIFAGMVVAAVDIVAIFTVPLHGWAFVAFVSVAYVVFSTTFSMNDIAYWGMMPALSSDPHERNKVATIAGLCAATGGGLLSLAAPALTAGRFALGGSAVYAYGALSVIVAVCFVGFQTLTLAGVKETRGRDGDDKAEKLTVKDMTRTITQNDQLLWACLTLLILLVGGGIYNTLVNMYIYLTYGYDGALLSVLSMLGIIGFPVTMLMPALLKRAARKKVAACCVALVPVGMALALVSGFALPREPYGVGFWLLGAGALSAGIGSALFSMIISISIANTVEYNEWKTGARRDSLIFSLRPFITQFGSAITQLIMVIVFLVLGLNAVNGRISVLEQEANRGLITSEVKNGLISETLKGVPSGIPSALLVCMMIGYVLFSVMAYVVYAKKYILDEKKYAEIMEDLKERAKQ